MVTGALAQGVSNMCSLILLSLYSKYLLKFKNHVIKNMLTERF